MDEFLAVWEKIDSIVIGGLIGVVVGLAFNYAQKKARQHLPFVAGEKRIYKTDRIVLVLFLIPAFLFLAMAVFGIFMDAPYAVPIIFSFFGLFMGGVWYFYLKSYLVIENNSLTFHSWLGSTTINWSDIKQARTKWRSAIVLDTTEDTLLFREGWIGMNDFVEQLFENVPMERIGTKNDFKEILAKFYQT